MACCSKRSLLCRKQHSAYWRLTQLLTHLTGRGHSKCLDLAKLFHSSLKIKFHKPTYQFHSIDLGTVDRITFGQEEFFYKKQRVLGVETIEPSLKASTRGECTMYVDMYHQEITKPLPAPNKTFVAHMCRISDFREGGDGTG